MSGKDRVRNLSSGLSTAFVLLAVMLGTTAPVRAEDGMWNSVLEKLNLKATPADPPPDFVEKTRPDSGGLTYMPPAVPHRVSPLAVKTPDQIQAKKDALDAAQARQSAPNAPAPLQAAKVPGAARTAQAPKAKRPDKAKPAPAVAD